MIKDRWVFKSVEIDKYCDDIGFGFKWSAYPVWLNTARVHDSQIEFGHIVFCENDRGDIECHTTKSKEFVKAAMDHFLNEAKYDR
jgi:hypothetical protein